MANKRIRNYDDGSANVTSTDMIGVDRAGLDELERVTLAQAVAAGGLTAHLNDTSDAHDASAISFSATGSITATDAQAAIAEVASDAATALSTHEADTTSVHGIADTSALALTANVVARATFPVVIGVAASDETTTLTTGTGKVTFRMPHAMTVTAVRASLTTASSSGVVTVDINEGGTSILSTKLTVDASEKTSTTAATAAVISDSALADDAEITVDIDQAGTGAAGLKVWLIGTRSV